MSDEFVSYADDEDEELTLDDEDQFARVCLYGRYGTGKTTDIAHGAKLTPDERHVKEAERVGFDINKLGKVVIVDAEHRLKAGPLQELGVPTNRIEPHRTITNQSLRDLVTKVRGRLHDNPGSVGVFALDAMDEITGALIRQVVDANLAKLESRARRRGEILDASAGQVDVDMWGILVDQLSRLFRDMRDLPCHQMFTSHERVDAQSDGTTTIGPATSPAIQSTIMGYVDILGHTSVTPDGVYVASFAPGTKYQAKDIYNRLPKLMVNPTLDRIIAYTKKELYPGNDPVQDAFDAARAAQMAALGDQVVAGDGSGKPARVRRSQQGA